MNVTLFHRMIGLVFVGILFLTSFSAGAEDVVLICNKKVPDVVLTDADVKDIFLGKKSKWSDGTRIDFATHQNAETHTLFLKNHIGRTVSQFRNYWKKEVFTGKGRMPKAFADDQQMLNFVMNTEGAVGYVSSSAQTDKVGVISVK